MKMPPRSHDLAEMVLNDLRDKLSPQTTSQIIPEEPRLTATMVRMLVDDIKRHEVLYPPDTLTLAARARRAFPNTTK